MRGVLGAANEIVNIGPFEKQNIYTKTENELILIIVKIHVLQPSSLSSSFTFLLEV